MAILTLDVPETVAQAVAELSDDDRAVYLARMKDSAWANLPTASKNGNGLHVGKDDEINDEADDNEDEEDEWPVDIFVTHPLPPILTESLADDMRAARADVDAGRLIPGHIALAELRRLTGRE